MHLLIAPNAFKNALPAQQAAEALEEGIKLSKLPFTTHRFAVADGGDGTGLLLAEKLQGSPVAKEVQDPLGRAISGSFWLVDSGSTAIIELANASGIRLLKPEEYNPLLASTFGTGQLIQAALDMQVNKIILCIGGSATVDGGTGIARALGYRFYDANGNELEQIGQFASLTGIDTTRVDIRIHDVKLEVLCDVKNKLLGEHGAAAVFGPQKGATGEMISQLDNVLAKLRAISGELTGKDMAAVIHGGAAGGVAAGVYALLNAELKNGIEDFLDLTGFDDSLSHANWVITGEGSIDEQTLEGKGPFGVAQRAKKKSKPVIGVAGKTPAVPVAGMSDYFDILLNINNEDDDPKAAIEHTYPNLVRAGQTIAQMIKKRQIK